MKKIYSLAYNLHIIYSGGVMKFFLIFLASFPLLAGSPTLKTITIDGNPSDWAEVLANPVQVTIDGDGSSMPPEQCSTLSYDRDCPVGSNGRDLNTFAWTYDATYIYIYQTRFGSTSNTQDFWFYMDVNRDQMMGNSDFILHVNYKGANRSTITELYTYSQDGGDPDPMVDTNGYADGYTIIGTYGQLLYNYRNLNSGFPDGTGFEVRVPWAHLGVPAGTGIYYHVGSSNSTNIPAQIDDNCGGPDGGIGAFGFYLLDVSPDNEGGSISPNTKNYNHTIKNTGTFNEVIDFKVFSTLAFSISIYTIDNILIGTDSNGDGDFEDLNDYLNLSFNSNSNGYPDITLEPEKEFELILSISIPANLENVMDQTTIFAWVEGENVSDYAIDKTYIGDIQIFPPLKLTGIASSYVYFPHTIIHYLAPDFITLKAFQGYGWEISLYYDSNADGTGDVLMATDLNGDGDFIDAGDYINPSYDSNSDSFPDTGILPPNSAFNFVISIKIPPSTPKNTENQIDVYAISSSINDLRQAYLTDTLIVKERFEFIPEYKDSEGNALYGAAGLSTFFPHSIINNSSLSDVAYLSYTSSYGVTALFWSDLNCDGSISDGSIITNTGQIPANGGRVCIVVEIQVPTNVQKGSIVSTQITATSQNNPSYSVSVLDELKVSMLIPYEDEIYSKQASKFSHCQNLYIKGYNFTPSNIYYLHYKDPANQEKKNSTKITNGIGQYYDDYNYKNNDLNGIWKVSADDGANVWDEIEVELEPNGNTNSISPFLTNKASYHLNDNITINLTLNNTNSYSSYKNSILKEVILTNDENLYWDGSIFSNYSGNEWTNIINNIDLNANSSYNLINTVNNVNFPYSGAYKIKSRWEASCNYLIADSQITFLVGTYLKTYMDNNFNVENQNFYLHEPVYIAGNYFYPDTSIKLAFYDKNGNFIETSLTNTNNSGYFSYIKDTSGWDTEGTVFVCVYPSTATIPSIYTPLDPDILALWNFNLERLPGLLRNDKFPEQGYAIFKQAYPLDPALDPINDLEKVDFKSGDSFPNEYNDLLPSSSYLIFYELDKNIETLKLRKSGNKIVVSY